MKVYNSILSDVEESIEAMESSIDPFNILNVTLITPDNDFLNIVRYIDEEKLVKYTNDFKIGNSEKLFNPSIKYTLWDYDLKIKCLRFIWFLCNKIIPQLYTYWDFSTKCGSGINITFDEILNNPASTVNIVNVHPYKLDSRMNSDKGIYAMSIISLSGASVLLLYTNNLKAKHD